MSICLNFRRYRWQNGGEGRDGQRRTKSTVIFPKSRVGGADNDLCVWRERELNESIQFITSLGINGHITDHVITDNHRTLKGNATWQNRDKPVTVHCLTYRPATSLQYLNARCHGAGTATMAREEAKTAKKCVCCARHCFLWPPRTQSASEAVGGCV